MYYWAEIIPIIHGANEESSLEKLNQSLTAW